MDAHPRGRRYVEKPANVESPGVAIHARLVLALEVRPEGAAHDRGVIDGRKQVDLAALIADSATDAGGFALLFRQRRVYVVRLYFLLEAFEDNPSSGGEIRAW